MVSAQPAGRAHGTTWGDIFMLNIDDEQDAAQQFRDVVRPGHAWYESDQRYQAGGA